MMGRDERERGGVGRREATNSTSLSQEEREMFDSGIGGTLAAAHQKVAFCLFAWAPIEWLGWTPAIHSRGKLMAALVACFCPPFTRFLEALSFNLTRVEGLVHLYRIW